LFYSFVYSKHNKRLAMTNHPASTKERILTIAGDIFGEKGYMTGMNYQGVMKNLPDLARPPLPPGVPAGGHGGSEGCSCHEQAGAGAMEQNQMGKMFGLMGDIVSGKANASTVTSLMGGCSDQFWKGALVGAGLAFLLTNPTVRQGLTGLWGGLFGGAKAEDEPCAAPAGEE